MKAKWNEKTSVDKILLLCQIVASVVTVVFALLQLFEVWDRALDVAVPLLGVVILLQSIEGRKEHKGAAVLGFCSAAFIFCCTLAVWLLK